MEDNVRIVVQGIQSEMIDDEKIELQTTGKWVEKAGKQHIWYANEDLVDLGLTKTRVTFDENSVSVTRSGAVNTHLIFETGVTHFIPYETPLGMLEMISRTKSILQNVTKDSIELEVKYNLEINQADLGENTFHIIAHRLNS